MRYVTVIDATKLMDVSRQAIQQAIKNGRLPAKKDSSGRYLILFDDLDRYLKSKWDRHETTRINGAKVFDKAIGGLSVTDAAEILGVREQHIYYAFRKGYIKKSRVGQVYLLREEDVYAYRNSSEFKQRPKTSNALAI
jgi:excisionase family DNA binding protein